MSVPFLLEIGTEEIPDWMIPGALDNLRTLFEETLSRAGVPAQSVRVDGTPRRAHSTLAAVARSLSTYHERTSVTLRTGRRSRAPSLTPRVRSSSPGRVSASSPAPTARPTPTSARTTP